jgi:hypothetical protein
MEQLELGIDLFLTDLNNQQNNYKSRLIDYE